MNRFFCFLLVFALGGCISAVDTVSWGESEFYELEVDSGGSVYYFQYPRGSVLDFDQNSGYFEYMGCKINFDSRVNVERNEDFDFASLEKNGVKFESWFKDNVFILYSGFLSEYGYYFWVYEDGNDVGRCMDFVEKASNSFTDSPLYLNDEYSFKVELFSDFKIDYLPSDEGVLMKKWFEIENEDGEPFGYKVEIVVYGFKNLMEFSDISEFVADKYPGYSLEFSSFEGDKTGVFVDEYLGEDAIRHYFFMSDDGNIIYEAYLKVPGAFYGNYKEKFDDFSSTIETF